MPPSIFLHLRFNGSATMKRRRRLALAALIAIAASFSTANATTVQISSITGGTITGPNHVELQNGTIVTIGLRIVSDGDDVFGLGVSAYGYDESILDFEGGIAVASLFHAYCEIGVGCFGGVPNYHAGPLVETSIGSNPNRVLLVDFPSAAAMASNLLDPGIDGVVGGGDDQVRISFRADALNHGSTTVIFGSDYPGDSLILNGGAQEMATPVAITIDIVP